MKVVFFVLNNASLLSPLVNELNANNIKGGTIFNSNGMGRELAKMDEFQIFGTLRTLLNPDFKESKTFMFVIDANKMSVLIETIEKIVGSLEETNNGILFSIPVDYVKGLKF